jgi:NAD(P)H-dependent FMN reductase
MSTTNRQPIRFLVFGASCRTGSLNQRLAELAASTITANGGEADLGAMPDFVAEPYSQDAQSRDGFPAPIESLRDRITASDAFVIASPEYNASLPGTLKNSIDWVSRFSPQPFNERHALLMSASPSMVGGNRGLWALRVPLEHLGARVYPDMFSLAQAHQGFSPAGQLLDDQLQERFEQTVTAFMDLVEASKHYPCVKTRWVEYLGERPDPAIDRVE